ncbi:MAG: thermonuclease family protein [Desulfomicrobium sp.]
MSALLVLCLAGGALAGQWRVTVEAVLDGDTLVLAGGERLRLRGIDAPEVRHKGKRGQYHGQKSAERLAALVSGRALVLDEDELDTDRYGRLVGTARLTDGRIVNLLMIEQGAAFVYPHPSDKDEAMAARLLDAQVRAMSEGRGFWPEVLGAPGARAGFVGTRNSRRFHLLSCAQGRKIRAANRVWFSSLREAFAAGYAPARECTPWPEDSGR